MNKDKIFIINYINNLSDESCLEITDEKLNFERIEVDGAQVFAYGNGITRHLQDDDELKEVADALKEKTKLKLLTREETINKIIDKVIQDKELLRSKLLLGGQGYAMKGNGTLQEIYRSYYKEKIVILPE